MQSYNSPIYVRAKFLSDMAEIAAVAPEIRPLNLQTSVLTGEKTVVTTELRYVWRGRSLHLTIFISLKLRTRVNKLQILISPNEVVNCFNFGDPNGAASWYKMGNVMPS